MAYDLTILEEGCQELGITLDEVQKKQFTDFYEYLVEKNKVMNLTGITEFQEVLVKHFLDSLACVKAVDMSKVNRIMDIGTGAGFPGVPLKIAFPHLEACLLDSLKKRVNFLEETFQLLKLENITAIHGRAEEFAKNKACGAADTCHFCDVLKTDHCCSASFCMFWCVLQRYKCYAFMNLTGFG